MVLNGTPKRTWHAFFKELDERPLWKKLSTKQAAVDKKPLQPLHPLAVFFIHLLTTLVYLSCTAAVVLSVLQLDTALTAAPPGATFGRHVLSAHQLLFATVVCGSLLAFFRVRGSNPGFLSRPGSLDGPDTAAPWRPAPALKEDGECGDATTMEETCRQCSATQDATTKHCAWCNRCVPEFDHHCAWVACCVGRDNHGRFHTFLLAETAAIAVALYHTISSLTAHTSAAMLLQSDPRADHGTARGAGWVSPQARFAICIGLLVFLCLFGLAIGGLLLFHTYLAFTGLNTRQVQHDCGGRRTYAHVRRGGCSANLAAFFWPGSAEVAALAEAPLLRRWEAGCGTVCSNRHYSCC